MQDVFPVAFLPKDHALAVAIMSYNGRMNFGLLGDFDAMPDIESFGAAIASSIAELVALARKGGGNERSRVGAGAAPEVVSAGDPRPRVGRGRSGLAVAGLVDRDRREFVRRAAVAARTRNTCLVVVVQPAHRPAVGRAPDLVVRDARGA